MARRKTGRSRPVSEKDAGETSGSSDEVAELLDGAETPEGVSSGPVEAVASGAQPMPGSASDREERAEPAKPKKETSKKTKKDLRALAPKKGAPKNRRALPPTKPGPSALETVLSRGVDPGDTETIAPVELFRVTKGGRAMIGGRLCEIKVNARITRLTHDLKTLRLQGIELELVGRAS